MRKSFFAPIAVLALTGAIASAGSISVKDAGGNPQSLLTFAFNGLQAQGVALVDATGAQVDPATKQGQTAIVNALGAPYQTGGALPLPAGASTETTLAAIKGLLTSPTLPSGAAADATLQAIKTTLGSPYQAGGALPLPNGAATSLNQSTMNGYAQTTASAVGAAGAPAGFAQTVQGNAAGTPLNVYNYLPQLVGTPGKAYLFGTASTVLFDAKPDRHYIQVQVQSSSADCYINGLGDAAVANGTSLGIPRSQASVTPIGGYFEPASHVGTGAINIICTGANTPVYARQG